VENQFDQNKLTIYDAMTEQLPEKHRSISTHLSKQAGSPHKPELSKLNHKLLRELLSFFKS
jgi:hypothetical protein